MLFMDLLDSSKTANGGEAGVDWWRPKPKDRDKAVALAGAGVISRLLKGYSIRASNPQLMDSVATLSMIPKLTTLKGAINPPLIAVFHGREKPLAPVPGSLVTVAQNYFESKNFITSAWYPINQAQAQIVARNLRTNENESTRFSRMLRDTGIDPQFRKELQDRADNLQLLYEYLKKYDGACANDQDAVEAFRQHPESMPSIWTYLQKIQDRSDGLGIRGEYLRQMEEALAEAARAKDRSLSEFKENRSELYNALGKIVKDQQERERIQGHIDVVYNVKVASTVSSGDGLFSMSDVTLPIDQLGVASEFTITDSIRKNFVKNSNVEIELLATKKDVDVQKVTWDHINPIWENPDYWELVEQLRIRRISLADACNNGSAEEIAEAQERMQCTELALEEKLTENLGAIIAKDKQKKGAHYLIDLSKDVVRLGLSGFMIAYIHEQAPSLPIPVIAPMVVGVVETVVTPKLEKLVEKLGEHSIQAYAKGEVQDWLEMWKPVKRESDGTDE